MSWSEDDFFSAFTDAGMLNEAQYQPAVGVPIPFNVGYTQPDQIVIDGMVHSTEHTVEYQAADISLARGDVIQIKVNGNWIGFRVRQTPLAKGDGAFVSALLEQLP